MKKRDVVVGDLYRVSHRGKTIIVRLNRERDGNPGWAGLDIATRRPVTVAAASRIQSRCDRNGKALPPAARPAKPSRKAAIAQSVKAVQKGDLTKGIVVPAGDRKASPADRENARLAAERAATPDGMTASERAMSAAANAGKKAGAKRGKRGGPAKGKAAKAAKAKPGKAAKAKPAKAAKAKPAKGKRRGILDLAADLLSEIGKPRTPAELVTQAIQRGLWSTKGKTPAATLYAAIIREISAKGGRSRFRKTAANTFELTAVGKAAVKAAR